MTPDELMRLYDRGVFKLEDLRQLLPLGHDIPTPPTKQEWESVRAAAAAAARRLAETGEQHARERPSRR